MQFICVFLAVSQACYASTTTQSNHVTHTLHTHLTRADHTTREQAETDMITFQFHPATRHLVVLTKTDRHTVNCYIATLTDAEYANTHTDYGMRSVELRILGALGSATEVIDVNTLDQRDVTYCGTHNVKATLYTISV
ncbi:hypothetical protein DPMN_118135 [Dreissena polymorpha]|uniref:Uncharacterized protein n=1 Tax=Dreissena polymorpha TaxID=45954 RepID=A0A9D4GMK1_DREPO|nr:hypothetical protein DPMN_118135 [Dreissena polymorpha]